MSRSTRTILRCRTSTLGLEYRRVADAHGLTAAGMGRLAVEGIESTWLDASDRAAMRREFEWTPADPELPLYRLVAAQAERTARTVSCHQDIAAQSAFTLMLVAEFDAPLAENPAAYRHLHWEAGMLGHRGTLEAEATGWRGTGIGCFFDDADHEILGLTDNRYQVIYHYAIGMALDDSRITTLPAYGG